EGAVLDALDVATLTGFLPEIDEESRALLMAYLDRREPRWREHAQGDATTGADRRAWSGGKMTEEEAYQILGVQPGASAEDIGRAHRALMKKLHPDQGGSTYLAARVNEAKEGLLRPHRLTPLPNATLAAPVRRGVPFFASTSVLDGHAFDVVFLEVFAGGFRRVLVESSEARAIIGGATLIDRFGESFRAGEHFRR